MVDLRRRRSHGGARACSSVSRGRSPKPWPNTCVGPGRPCSCTTAPSHSRSARTPRPSFTTAPMGASSAPLPWSSGSASETSIACSRPRRPTRCRLPAADGPHRPSCRPGRQHDLLLRDIQAIALIELAKAGWVESVELGDRCCVRSHGPGSRASADDGRCTSSRMWTSTGSALARDAQITLAQLCGSSRCSATGAVCRPDPYRVGPFSIGSRSDVIASA